MLDNSIQEVIFVGLPGPTHHYGGLSGDNVAATSNRGSQSAPKEAALQALELVRLLRGLGLRVGVLPPQLRPHMPLLRQHFEGEDDRVIRQAALEAPGLLEKASSSSAMWVANAATVAPSCDTADSKLHLTVANLFSNLHRRIEAEDTFRVLAGIFAKVPGCVVHPPLSAAAGMHDEGAANHMRFAPAHGAKGLHVFVYGADGSRRDPQSARQTLSASRAVAQQHALPGRAALFIRQNPAVIQQGVFHNDVIAVSHLNVLLAHAEAFEDGLRAVDEIVRAYTSLHPTQSLCPIVIEDDELTVEEAVHTYFFNSQIVSGPEGMVLIAPKETELLYDGKALALMQRICADPGNPIREVRTVDLRQSMRNGGGPACLRLRVPMNGAQVEALGKHTGVLADDDIIEELAGIIHAHYPDTLTPQALANPLLLAACRRALEGFSDVMKVALLP